jgi:ABC-type iron transport system FetAB ATPase subunit
VNRALLQVQGVGVTLGGRPAVERAHLALDAGELLGLLGPNGAGKTTLLRAVLGLVPLTHGETDRRAAPGPPTGPPSTRHWNWSASPTYAGAPSVSCPAAGGSGSSWPALS